MILFIPPSDPSQQVMTHVIGSVSHIHALFGSVFYRFHRTICEVTDLKALDDPLGPVGLTVIQLKTNTIPL